MVAAASLDYKDGDGKGPTSELRKCMAAALISEEEAAAILMAVDADGDGLLDCNEFIKLAHEAAGEDDIDGRHKCLREAFRMYAAAEGEEPECITPASMSRMLNRLGSPQQLGMDDCRAMICRFDLDGDGVLSFDEFRIMMHDGLM